MLPALIVRVFSGCLFIKYIIVNLPYAFAALFAFPFCLILKHFCGAFQREVKATQSSCQML